MGKCSNCGEKIRYNKFKMYRGKILCPDCYATRLERKKQKKLDAENNLKEMNITDEVKNYDTYQIPENAPEERTSGEQDDPAL